jgi:hypothetical protein
MLFSSGMWVGRILCNWVMVIPWALYNGRNKLIHAAPLWHVTAVILFSGPEQPGTQHTSTWDMLTNKKGSWGSSAQEEGIKRPTSRKDRRILLAQ